VRPWQCVLNGAKAFALMARARVWEMALAFAVMTPLVLVWHVEGALYSIALTNLVALFTNWWMFRKLAPVQEAPAATVGEVAPLRTLLRYGSAALATAMLGNGLGLLVRRRIITHLGLDTSGLYQVAFSLTQQYLGLVLSAMAVYSFPAYRAVRSEPARMREEVNHTVRGALLVIVPIIAVLLTLRTVFIRALFSADYLAAEQMLRIQLMGDFFKVVAWALGLTILASGRVRVHVLLEVLLGSTWLIGVETLTRTFGPLGPPLAFSLNQVLMCVVYYTIMHRSMQFRIERGNWRLMAVSLALLAAVNASTAWALPISVAFTLAGVGIWAWLCVKPSELRGLMRYVTERVRRRTGG
jgi:O-antigen/teichoic acid export membrane protein